MSAGVDAGASERKAEADVKKACVERVNACCQNASWPGRGTAGREAW